MPVKNPDYGRGISKLVLNSGGLDSAACLTWARSNTHDNTLGSIAFNYGQRHAKTELRAARLMAEWMGIEHTEIDIRNISAMGGRMFDTAPDAAPLQARNAGKGNVFIDAFVPNRNMILASIAAGFAMREGYKSIVMGLQSVNTIMPDQNDEFRQMLQIAINSGRNGRESQFHVWCPVMYASKEEEIHFMHTNNRMELLALTVSCYSGEEKQCGLCSACETRSMGFARAGIKDPANMPRGPELERFLRDHA